MPVIVFSSPKGGAGKTTAATILATELALSGSSVTIIDADPNRNVVEWATRPGVPEILTVIGDASEQTIMDQIELAAVRTEFVVVDLEGTASLTAAYAISLADFVIIPVRGSHLDARQAGRAISMVRQQERATRRSIPFAILMTCTKPAITPRTPRHIGGFSEVQLPVLRTQLHDREAYRALFSVGGTLSSLTAKDASNLVGATANARQFAAEVVELLRGGEARDVA
jgi:chromosome partitioning protein